jgi:hypothetical protein
MEKQSHFIEGFIGLFRMTLRDHYLGAVDGISENKPARGLRHR